VRLPWIGRRFGPLLQPVVTNDVGNAQALVFEHRSTPGSLSRPLRMQIAPSREAGVIAPELQRQQLARLRQTLKPLDGNESIHLQQFGVQLGRPVQVARAVGRFRPDFKDHGNHLAAPYQLNQQTAVCGRSVAVHRLL
jgi:hypothetical protein